MALRSALHLSLQLDEAERQNLLVRQGRAITWLKEALAPISNQLSEQAMMRVVYAIRASAGIEALVWLCDVAGLSRDEARELMMWSAQSLLRSILIEANAGQAGQVPD